MKITESTKTSELYIKRNVPSDICVICGAYVPEGTMVCNECSKAAEPSFFEMVQEKKKRWESF